MERNKEQILSEDARKPNFLNNPNATSPLSASKLVAKVNLLSSTSASSRVSALSALANRVKNNESNTYKQVVDAMLSIVPAKDVAEFYLRLHRILIKYLGSSFTAFGLYNEMSQCINLKLVDKADNVFVSKVFKSDSSNPVIKAFTTQSILTEDNVNYLNLAYFHNHAATIIPMVSVNKCIGVMIIADDIAESNRKLCSFVANYAATVINNFTLIEQANAHVNTDALTQLYNHRGFQECLSKSLVEAEQSGQDLSIVMLDVNNISKINRELGHAKGDEVIKLVAEKVKHNIRKSDMAGRYGGDEIAIILPNTDVDDAKYIAEYITYSLSCCFVDDVGPVKVSVGIASYPECAKDQEKLLILAEQAMYISQAQGYKDGMSAIISSSDFNFWDDVALHSYAEVLSKRHAQMGVNFE